VRLNHDRRQLLYRDDKRIAIVSAEYLESMNPGVEVTVRDCDPGAGASSRAEREASLIWAKACAVRSAGSAVSAICRMYGSISQPCVVTLTNGLRWKSGPPNSRSSALMAVASDG
jgi:hypothetical protein